MSEIWYAISARDSQTGMRLAGLKPSWSLFRGLETNADIVPLPVISEVALGIYRFAYDAETGGDAVGQIDLFGGASDGSAGAIIIDDATRYVDVLLTRDSGRLLMAVDSSGSVKLGPSGLDDVTIEVGTNARQAISLIAAAAAGLLSGAGTDTILIRGVGTDEVRIGAIVDEAGNRASVTTTRPL